MLQSLTKKNQNIFAKYNYIFLITQVANVVARNENSTSVGCAGSALLVRRAQQEMESHPHQQPYQRPCPERDLDLTVVRAEQFGFDQFTASRQVGVVKEQFRYVDQFTAERYFDAIEQSSSNRNAIRYCRIFKFIFDAKFTH